MVRDNLQGYPDRGLPEGYRFRLYREGDAIVWTELHIAAEPFIEVTPELFDREFGPDLGALGDRMYFVETDAGEDVGSITAWWESQRDRPHERGRIHWVVVHPDHQGRGIAKAMMTRAMQRLERSHDSAMLGTSSGRPAAIRIYLDFGFLPDLSEIEDPNVAAAWSRLQATLSHPVLQQRLSVVEGNTER